MKNETQRLKPGYYRCPRCGMKFYTWGGLDQHFAQNPGCKDWADIQLIAAGIYKEEDDA